MQVCESHTYCNRYHIWSDRSETARTPVLTSPSCDILIPILSFKAICQDFLSQVSLYPQLASFSVLVSVVCDQIDGTQSRPLSALELFLVCADIWSALRMSCNKVLLSRLIRHKASTVLAARVLQFPPVCFIRTSSISRPDIYIVSGAARPQVTSSGTRKPPQGRSSNKTSKSHIRFETWGVNVVHRAPQSAQDATS